MKALGLAAVCIILASCGQPAENRFVLGLKDADPAHLPLARESGFIFAVPPPKPGIKNIEWEVESGSSFEDAYSRMSAIENAGTTKRSFMVTLNISNKRFPSYFELRYHAFLAASRGADSIVFADSGESWSQSPEHWQAVARVAGELSALAPIFSSGKPIAPTEKLSKGLDAALWHWHGKDYLILLNHGKDCQPPPGSSVDSRWRPLFEIRRDAVETLALLGHKPCLDPGRVLVLEGSY